MTKMATRHQLVRIVQLYANNQLPFEATQEFIKARGVKKRNGKKAKPSGPNQVFWEVRFPGRGMSLMEVLKPFYGWKAIPKPAATNLEINAKNLIFWRKTAGVHVIHKSEEATLEHVMIQTLESSLYESLKDPLALTIGSSLKDPLEASLGTSLKVLLGESVWASLCASLYYCCAYTLVGKSDEAIRLKPLLAFWRTNNFPIGFDKEDNLLVLVADA